MDTHPASAAHSHTQAAARRAHTHLPDLARVRSPAPGDTPLDPCPTAYPAADLAYMAEAAEGSSLLMKE